MNTLTFKQSTPSDLWEINHQLGGFPASDVMVYVDGGILQKAFPKSVEYIDPDRIAIHFSALHSGEVRLVSLGRSSFNVDSNPVEV